MSRLTKWLSAPRNKKPRNRPSAGARRLASRLTARGHRRNGRHSHISVPPEWRGTTKQLCGWWPFAVGGTSPTVGAPLGLHYRTRRAVNGDPISWFTIAKLMSNPSWFILGMPGLGKSSLARRLLIALCGIALPMVLGDLKGEYVDTVRALGGQVIKLGRGQGSINVLDVGAIDQAADLMTAAATREARGKTEKARKRAAYLRTQAGALRAEAHGRRVNILKALLTVVRGRKTEDYEDAILSAALRVLAAQWKTKRTKAAPLLRDLIDLVNSMPDEVRLVALDHGDEREYRRIVDPLVRSLLALCDGALGEMFARQTTERLNLDAPAICVDVSSISDGDDQLAAAALIVAWSEGFGAIKAANVLADAGLGPQRWYLAVLDELWKVLGAGEGLVDRVNGLTRTNRTDAVSQIMITHTLKDMAALNNSRDRENARGFVERAGAVVCFGLPDAELDELNEIVRFSDEERRLLRGWSSPRGWKHGDEQAPGCGCCVIKVGERAGLPVQVLLVEAELGLNETSRRWITDLAPEKELARA